MRTQALPLVRRLLWHHDQPYGDSSAIPTYQVSRLARQHVTVVLNGDGSVGGFVPRGAAATGTYHFIGVQAVEAEAFEALRPGAAGNSIGGVFDRLLAERSGLIRGYVSDARFWDIGTVRDYWKTSLALSGGRFEPVGHNVRIHPSAVVERSIVWDNVEVGESATIDRCILTDGVSVAPGSVFRGSVLLQTTDGRSIGMPLAENLTIARSAPTQGADS